MAVYWNHTKAICKSASIPHASTFPRFMLLSCFLLGRVLSVCEQALPEFSDARLRLRRHEAMTLVVKTAELCASILTHLRERLVDDLEALHQLLDILKPGMVQDVDQAERHQRRLAK